MISVDQVLAQNLPGLTTKPWLYKPVKGALRRLLHEQDNPRIILTHVWQPAITTGYDGMDTMTFIPADGSEEEAEDDEEDSLAFAAAALRAAGADVRTAGSADQALAMMAVSPPDVLVADIAMPGKDGYTLLRELRGRPAGAVPPAVALTAYAGELHRRAALDAGFTEHLEKPVDPDRLTAVVSELARRTVAS